MIPRVSLYIVAALLIAAHFLRQGSMVLTVLCLLVPLLFFLRRQWSLIVLQAAAYLSAGKWLVTAALIVQQRVAEGRSWTAAAVILGVVAALTIAAGALLNSGAITEKYPR
jgi:hypothetical protein